MKKLYLIQKNTIILSFIFICMQILMPSYCNSFQSKYYKPTSQRLIKKHNSSRQHRSVLNNRQKQTSTRKYRSILNNQKQLDKQTARKSTTAQGRININKNPQEAKKQKNNKIKKQRWNQHLEYHNKNHKVFNNRASGSKGSIQSKRTQTNDHNSNKLKTISLSKQKVLSEAKAYLKLHSIKNNSLKNLKKSELKSKSVWSKADIERGKIIEKALAKTDYKDYFYCGKLINGKFPLVDFQKGNDLVSVKSSNTKGKTWKKRMQEHIIDLKTRGATYDGQKANMILDLRVQPGGYPAAQSLIQYGQKNNVKVIIKEFQ